ncbi:MAG: hypothetical protein IPN75_09305 [Dechloromonas sp.]|uniref:Uncharacterized protein n=1 Tax=Candidatus Dechloromonas phosphorivorans TaxID=2899244 RepID=A0A9D7QIU4_9RHOO|nr:hypothetical protein [Candidatus Dechloromonas phosphorivorans]
MVSRTDQDRFDDAFVEGDDQALQRFPVARVRPPPSESAQGRGPATTSEALVLVVADQLGDGPPPREIFSVGAQNFRRSARDLQAFLVGADAVESHAYCDRNFCLAVTVMVMVSPVVTGRAKCKV